MSQSNLPQVQRLKYEDYANASNFQAAIQTLVNNLNLFITPTYNILNGGIAYQNLVAPQLFTKVITAATVTTFTFTNPLTIQPSAVLVGNVWTGIRSTHPATAVQAFWHSVSNNIVIDAITGLTTGVSYTITLVIL